MKIKRRSFLKYLGFGTLANLNSLKGKNSDTGKENKGDKLDLVGKCHYDFAQHDLDSAEEYLTGLINKEYTGPHRTYASNIDSATRFIHCHAWSWLPGIERVEKQFIPLLEKARDSINENDPKEIKEHNPKVIGKNSDYPTYAIHVKACISSRIFNLMKYSKGLNSDMEACFKKVEKEGEYKFI